MARAGHAPQRSTFVVFTLHLSTVVRSQPLSDPCFYVRGNLHLVSPFNHRPLQNSGVVTFKVQPVPINRPVEQKRALASLADNSELCNPCAMRRMER